MRSAPLDLASTRSRPLDPQGMRSEPSDQTETRSEPLDLTGWRLGPHEGGSAKVGEVLRARNREIDEVRTVGSPEGRSNGQD